MVSTGCFYLGPTPTLATNEPPMIDSFSYANGETIPVVRAGIRVFLIAHDADEGDVVHFDWSLKRQGYIGTSQPLLVDAGRFGSQVDLAWDEALEGDTLRCDLSDGESESYYWEWPLEVL